MSGPMPTARDAGLAVCHDCGQLVRLSAEHHHCPRCHAVVHLRTPNSIARSWALLIAAAICYIPANVLPVTVVDALGQIQGDTIMSGVLYFLHHGDWPLALVIFTASIAVPMSKIAMLMYLLVSVQRRSVWRPADRTRVYRIVELIGRWSMLDMFVVTILVALVQLGFFATMHAGAGAPYFGAVVVLTMLAAQQFDPRLIWDTVEAQDDRQES
ncbi:MAG: paraquat-inducible protein A [Gammaproteobacteria bacterium]